MAGALGRLAEVRLTLALAQAALSAGGGVRAAIAELTEMLAELRLGGLTATSNDGAGVLYARTTIQLDGDSVRHWQRTRFTGPARSAAEADSLIDAHIKNVDGALQSARQAAALGAAAAALTDSVPGTIAGLGAVGIAAFLPSLVLKLVLRCSFRRVLGKKLAAQLTATHDAPR